MHADADAVSIPMSTGWFVTFLKKKSNYLPAFFFMKLCIVSLHSRMHVQMQFVGIIRIPKRNNFSVEHANVLLSYILFIIMVDS